MLEKPLQSLAEADLQELVSSGVSERRTIEYKRALPGGADEDKKEFLADASSLANAAGGSIVYGIEENSGVPTTVKGVVVVDADKEKLRLESLLRDGISPRIHGIELSDPINIASGGVAFVLRVPRSLNPPHMVTFKGHWKFYARNSAGKYALNVEELRHAFAFSAATRDRLRDFRAERISKLLAESGPEQLFSKSLITLHLMPLSAFESDNRLDAISLESVCTQRHLQPIYTTGAYNGRYNFDGYLLPYKHDSSKPAWSYLQLFRDGIFETVNAIVLSGKTRIASFDFEEKLLQALPQYFVAMAELGFRPPIFIALSLTGIKGYTMGLPQAMAPYALFNDEQPIPCDRDSLLLPEVVAESMTPSFGELMKPVFDSVWNAMGHKCSMYYDGVEWKGMNKFLPKR